MMSLQSLLLNSNKQRKVGSSSPSKRYSGGKLLTVTNPRLDIRDTETAQTSSLQGLASISNVPTKLLNLNMSKVPGAQAETKLEEGYQIHRFDVLCHKDKASYFHVGNCRLRVCIEMRLGQHLAAKRRQDKSKLIQEVIAAVRESGGRFLRRVGSHPDQDEHDDYKGEQLLADVDGENGNNQAHMDDIQQVAGFNPPIYNYYDIGDKKAAEKIGKVFRYMIRRRGGKIAGSQAASPCSELPSDDNEDDNNTMRKSHPLNTQDASSTKPRTNDIPHVMRSTHKDMGDVSPRFSMNSAFVEENNTVAHPVGNESVNERIRDHIEPTMSPRQGFPTTFIAGPTALVWGTASIQATTTIVHPVESNGWFLPLQPIMPCHGYVGMAGSEPGAAVGASTATQCGAIDSYQNEAICRSINGVHTYLNYQPSHHDVIDLTDKNDASQSCRKQLRETKKQRSSCTSLDRVKNSHKKKRTSKKKQKKKKTAVKAHAGEENVATTRRLKRSSSRSRHRRHRRSTWHASTERSVEPNLLHDFHETTKLHDDDNVFTDKDLMSIQLSGISRCSSFGSLGSLFDFAKSGETEAETLNSVQGTTSVTLGNVAETGCLSRKSGGSI
jgi:hypothetical protein